MSKTIWFTGLPCAGKTTLAAALGEQLASRGVKVFLLDGDELRKGLNSDLGFSEADRRENLRRAAEVARLLMMGHDLVLASYISPFEADRLMVRNIIGSAQFVEVFVDCDLKVCEQRDVKGMYKRARTGELKNFTGIQAPYETPKAPDVVIRTDLNTLAATVTELRDKLKSFL